MTGGPPITSDTATVAAVAAVITAGAGWAVSRIRRHSSDPTAIELLQQQNADLRDQNEQLKAGHAENARHIRDLQKQQLEMQQQIQVLHTELRQSRERIGYLTGQLTARHGERSTGGMHQDAEGGS